MSEQKYYVRLNRCAYIKQKEGCVYHDVIWLDDDWEFVKEDSRQSFAKSELAEIMGGALYREPFLGEAGIQPEWINPLIELVPVDEV